MICLAAQLCRVYAFIAKEFIQLNAPRHFATTPFINLLNVIVRKRVALHSVFTFTTFQGG